MRTFSAALIDLSAEQERARCNLEVHRGHNEIVVDRPRERGSRYEERRRHEPVMNGKEAKTNVIRGG